ncbi:MAG TPA: Lrp/AsnC family transcriptional regulator [Candidatus Acidoferrum sp.]|nr:Lrp/AsnC family transcriptional regulator [Candidatus Acidoferrum sp.]
MSDIKRKILRELSENSRISITHLAAKLHCSRNTISSNIKRLEEEYGMQYILDFNKQRLGLTQLHVWLVKFDRMPPHDVIKRSFAAAKGVQIVAQTNGDFDLFAFIIADTPENYVKNGMAAIAGLLDYKPKISIALLMLKHTGFFPVDDYAIELFSNRFKLSKLDIRLLSTLNSNSRLGYGDLAKRLGTSPETIRYRMKRIARLGVIDQFTIVLKRPPLEHTSIFSVDYELAPGVLARARSAQGYYLSSDGKGLPIMNRFQFLGLMSGAFLLLGICYSESEERAIRDVVLAHKELYRPDNPEIRFAEVTRIIKGALPARSLDLKKHFHSLS